MWVPEFAVINGYVIMPCKLEANAMTGVMIYPTSVTVSVVTVMTVHAPCHLEDY